MVSSRNFLLQLAAIRASLSLHVLLESARLRGPPRPQTGVVNRAHPATFRSIGEAVLCNGLTALFRDLFSPTERL